MAVFRVERNKGYTVMSNHHLRNKELSLKAKGLLSQMLSLPEDWDYTLAGLSFINREKIDAIREAVKESLQSRRASFYHGAKIRNSAVLPLAGNLLGSAFPKPCSCALTGEKGGHTMRKKYNTPHRSRVVKTRLSEDEYADFTARLAPYGISQSEFLRQAIRRATIRPVVHVSSVNDELLSAVGKLTAEYGRIGGNLNQIARYLNEYGVPYNTLSGEVRAAISDLAVLKYEVLKKVGDAVGNTQAYQL